ncbi:major facilitator superfamily domain-containing protein 1 [Lingula anatina]|uniref:Lysosomal dipeptide transporter MFSD1 n=1 Tax=Lingula anatina TaxID=7574 RepID=A0A1S3KF32_LINAN|nr:major facilitator superfamily domain-containing protein 1 [Lingula anatina]|eukprot:XP_013421243.1 major facilitator superfamily domain-containing protein 1 [Lingula anatina]
MEDQEKKPLLGDRDNGPVVAVPEDDVVLEGCGGTLACDPRRALHKYLILIIMCFLSFGSYFCYDNPAALQDTMLKDLNINESIYMLFYSLYSWPNVILCFFGGFLIDRVFGIRLGAIIFSLFVTAGQVVFALGAFFNLPIVMHIGRFIFGIGGESLCVAQNTYAVSWFKDKELNMVFGLQLSFSRVGSTVNMNIMQPLYDAMKKSFPDQQGYVILGGTLMIGVGFCIASLFCSFALAYFDKRLERILRKEEAKTGEVISLRDIKDFPASVWLMCIICVAYYVAVFPFIGLGLVFFEMKFGLSPSAASACNSVVYIISAGASPLFGFCIDKLGKNIFWVITGVIITLACHACLAFTWINPFVPMVIMGFSYSILASALWPIVAMVVPEHQLGTAYGIMQAVQNLGLAVISMVSGMILDSKGYLVLEVFFLIWLCVALIASVLLYLVDAAKGGHINLSGFQRRKIQKANEEADEKSK